MQTLNMATKNTSNKKLQETKENRYTHSCRFQQTSKEVEYISAVENILYQDS